MPNGSGNRFAFADRRTLTPALLVLGSVSALFALGVAGNRRTSAFARVESFRDEIVAAAAESGIDPCVLASIVYVESGGRAGVRSSAGAVGLAQLKSAAADEARTRIERGPGGDGGIRPLSSDVADPATNLRLGAAYLATLLDRFREPDLAVAAYAIGPGAAERAVREAGGNERDAVRRMLERPGGPGDYVRKVRAFEARFRERGFPGEPSGG